MMSTYFLIFKIALIIEFYLYTLLLLLFYVRKKRQYVTTFLSFSFQGCIFVYLGAESKHSVQEVTQELGILLLARMVLLKN